MIVYNVGTQRASRSINGQLMDSILGSTLRSVDYQYISGNHLIFLPQLAGRDSRCSYHISLHSRYRRCRWFHCSNFRCYCRARTLYDGQTCRPRHILPDIPYSWYIRDCRWCLHWQHLLEGANVRQTRDEQCPLPGFSPFRSCYRRPQYVFLITSQKKLVDLTPISIHPRLWCPTVLQEGIAEAHRPLH